MLSGDNNARQKICYCSLNYLHKHFLSYYSINLCTCDTGVSSINPLPYSVRNQSCAECVWQSEEDLFPSL